MVEKYMIYSNSYYEGYRTLEGCRTFGVAIGIFLAFEGARIELRSVPRLVFLKFH